MADILALFGVILLVGAALSGLLTTHWLLFPGRVAAAAANLEQHPWRCLLLGAGMGLVVALPVLVLMAFPAGVTQFLAWVVIVAALAVSGIGTAGPSKAFMAGLCINSLGVAFSVSETKARPIGVPLKRASKSSALRCSLARDTASRRCALSSASCNWAISRTTGAAASGWP